MMYFVVFIAGGVFGALAMALCVASGRDDDREQ